MKNDIVKLLMKLILPIFILIIFVSFAFFGAFSMGHEGSHGGVCVLDCLAQAQYTLHQEIYTTKIATASSFLEPQTSKDFSVFVPDHIVVPI